MLDSATFSLFLVAALICIAMPGPAVIYVLANGLGRGRGASIAAACGTTAGVSVHVLAFLPQFVAPDAASPALAMLALGGLFMVMTLGVFVLYGLFATRLRAFVLARSRIMDGLRWLFASLFLALGLRLALAGRD